MQMPGRSFTSPTGYRYGFNGMEKDDEVNGANNSYDFGDRIYNPRLGRWLSVDPEFKKFSGDSPYSFAGNNPIFLVDEIGRTKITYLTIIAKNGERATLKIVNEKEVKTIFFNATGAHDIAYIDYDIYVHTVIDYSNLDEHGKPKINSSVKLAQIGKEKGLAAIPGNGGTIEADFGDGQPINVSEIVGLIGGGGMSPKAFSGFLNKLKNLLDKGDALDKIRVALGLDKIDLTFDKDIDATGFTVNADGNGQSAQSYEEGNIWKDTKGDTVSFYDKETHETTQYKDADSKAKASVKKWTPIKKNK